MKRQNQKSLILATETIRQLRDRQLAAINGGALSGSVTTKSQPNTCGRNGCARPGE